MVKRKSKTQVPAKGKDPANKKEDVKVQTGLPPQVEGQLRCFCRLAVNQIMWLVPVAPSETHIRVKWWGEVGEGALFRPVDMKKGNKGVTRTVARYPVRSGPKQFAAYLNDMDTLVLEVLSGPMKIQVGFAEVTGLGQLAPNSPINGFYDVFSPSDEKIAEVQVSVLLESVMESYDSTGDTIPTTDISMDTHVTQESSMYPQQRQPVPHSVPQKPDDDPFISPGTHQNGALNGHATAAADLRQQLNYSFLDHSHIQQPQHYPQNPAGRTVSVTTNGDVVTTDEHSGIFRLQSPDRSGYSGVTELPHRSESILKGQVQQNGQILQRSEKKRFAKKGVSPPRSPHRRNFSHPLSGANSSQNAGTSENSAADPGDLLSILLERGDKLRKQMIISSVDDSLGNNEMEPSKSATGGAEGGWEDLNMSRGSTGSFLKEILKAEKSHLSIGGDADGANLEEKAVDLVFGGDVIDDYQILKIVDGSPRSSVSCDLDLYSDPGDPVHSESLLKDLFYKNQESEVSGLSEISGDEEIMKQAVASVSRRSQSPAIEDPDNARPPSRRSSISSITLPLPVVEKEEKPKKTLERKSRTPKRKTRLKTKRKGSKKRKRSRSAASGSEYSDSENASTARSEMSQVSFDMPPSDIDEPEDDGVNKKLVDGLSIERLTLLGRVHVARVNIESLNLSGQNVSVTPSKKKTRSHTVGRPPKPSPKAKKAVTYFIEYQFPVVATSRDKHAPNAMATEVMRVASKNIKDGVVTFNHRSVFPIMFDGSVVDKWWKSALVFKLYSRSAGQKVPTQIGSCGVPLKSVLKSDCLQLDKWLEVRENAVSRSIGSSIRSSELDSLYGQLKISLELGSDSREFSSALAKTKLAEMTGQAKIVPLPKPLPSSNKPPVPPEVTRSAITTQDPVQHLREIHRETEIQMANDLSSDVNRLLHQSQQNIDHGLMHIPLQYNSNEASEVMTLHTLLLIPEGRNITARGVPCLKTLRRNPVFPPQPHSKAVSDISSRDVNKRNTYLVCRMFWCDDAVHSNVCWGMYDPNYNFIQIAPVLMSNSLLERMRNNFMIVEVWDKKTTAENDKLIGIVKLSLHQFYMSFRDKKISSALLRSQYPVISVDTYLPIVDPLTGAQFGQIKVLLAMGSAEQVSSLQRFKMEDMGGAVIPERPHHHLERNSHLHTDSSGSPVQGHGNTVEHIFEIVIEGIRGLSMFEKMMWGEADCFVQYHFPTQSQVDCPGAPNVKRATPSMKSYRSATTLCIPDPTFNEVTRHRFTLPQSTPVQRELLHACDGAGGGGGGVPFEVWCRFYHPNVRDQCIAKSSLPLAKLCAMVTMQKRNEPSIQSFSLNLSHVGEDVLEIDPEAEAKMKDCGLLDLTVHYKTQYVKIDSSNAVHKNLGNSQVCVSVGVLRACGLKTAAEEATHLDTGMEYPAEVGVNAYVKLMMSFSGREDERVTRTVARTFTPEFSHTMDFPLSLIWTEPDTEALSLAEILEGGFLTLELWHQIPGLAPDIDRQLLQMSEEESKGRQLISKMSDVLLGTTRVPFSTLLTHRTGINGWFPVSGHPSNQSTCSTDEEYHGSSLKSVVGGLELSIKFAHHNDRDRIIDAGRGVGWSPVNLQVEEEEDWMSDDESTDRYFSIDVNIEQANFPLQNALITGQNSMDKSTRCYVRYKLYDKAAVMSKVVKLAEADDYLTSELGHRHHFRVPASSPFRWYLREEMLEVQVWVSYGYVQGKKGRPQHRDKLIGTAYISMEALSDQRRRQHRVSGNYPLFKPGAVKLGGAFIRANVTLKPEFGIVRQDEDQTVLSDEVDPDYDPEDSFHKVLNHPHSRSRMNHSRLEKVEETVVPNFGVIISVDRAMHLPHICDKSRSGEELPNTYVTYQTVEDITPTCTSIYPRSDNPVWDHQHETKLSTELLFQENKNLVFKVWHSPSGKSPDKSTDRVLGFVSVDLTPLTSGMQQICGWYNIVDFNGQCKGQIKVNVIPQDSVIQYGTSGVTSSQPCSLPIGVNSSTHHAPAWFSEQPISLPINTKPFTSTLPHFEQHYESVRNHHEQLQLQLTQNIQAFLEQQQKSLESQPLDSYPVEDAGGSHVVQSEPSAHWVPSVPESRFEDSNASSRSFLFSSLRKQMQDLDEVTSKLKQRLVPSSHTVVQPERDIPNTQQSGHATLTSTRSGLSSLSSIHLMQSQRDSARTHDSDLMYTGSNKDESSQGVDSGAFSVTHSSEKYQYNEPLDSQRTLSDRLEAFRLRSPREVNIQTVESTPRDHNNSDTGIHVAYTPRDEDLTPVSTGAFQSGNTPRDPSSSEFTPREPHLSGFSPRGTGASSVPSSNPTSLGFQYQTDTSLGSQLRNGFSSVNYHENVTHEVNNHRDISIIQENAENEASEGEGDEKYYHRYRDILDEQQKDDDSDEVQSEEEGGEVIMPRTLNDVSGKFGGIPGRSGIDNMHSGIGAPREFPQKTVEQWESPREFHHSDHTMPFDITGADTKSQTKSNTDSRSNSGSKKTVSEAELSDFEELSHKDISFNAHNFYLEKDSWLTDGEGERSNHERLAQEGSRALLSHPENDQSKDFVEKDSWFSEDDIQRTHLDSSADQTVRSQSEMNGIPLKFPSTKVRLDTISSAGSRENDSFYHSKKEERDLLENVELDSVTSGTNTQKQESLCNSRDLMKSPILREVIENTESKTFDNLNSSGDLSKSPQQMYKSVVHELDDFFSKTADGDAENSEMNSSLETPRSEHSGNASFEQVYSANLQQMVPVSENCNNASNGEQRLFSQKILGKNVDCDKDSLQSGDIQFSANERLKPNSEAIANGIPDFFPPVQHLEQSMKALNLVTNNCSSDSRGQQAEDAEVKSAKAEAAQEIKKKLQLDRSTHIQHKVKSRQLPTAEEAKRIARIFSTKLS